MREQRPYIILGIAGLTIKLISQLCSCPLDIKGVWYVGDAVGWFFIILAVRGLVKCEKQYDTLTFFVGLSINNLIDELFFDPTKLQWNEVLFSSILLIWLVHKIRKWRKRK